MSSPLLLLVDDAAEIAVLVERLARRAGHEFVRWGDAESAWAYLQENQRRPDLVLLDVHLPGMSGLDWCRLVRATVDFQDLPLALFTQWGLPRDIAAGWQAGVDYVVSKDLVCLPKEWNERFGEILTVRNSRPQQLSLNWLATELDSASTESWRGFLAQALRQLGLEVMQAVMLRALRDAPPAFSHDWLSTDGLSLNFSLFAHLPRPSAAAKFLATVAQQVWCLLGSEAAAPCWQAAQLTPISREILSPNG